MKRPSNIDHEWTLGSFTWTAGAGDAFAVTTCAAANRQRLYALFLEKENARLSAAPTGCAVRGCGCTSPAKAEPALTEEQLDQVRDIARRVVGALCLDIDNECLCLYPDDSGESEHITSVDTVPIVRAALKRGDK